MTDIDAMANEFSFKCHAAIEAACRHFLAAGHKLADMRIESVQDKPFTGRLIGAFDMSGDTLDRWLRREERAA